MPMVAASGRPLLSLPGRRTYRGEASPVGEGGNMARKPGQRLVEAIRAAACGGRGEGVPDGDLLARYAGGQDDAAFASLVRRHAGMVLGIARRVLGHEQDAEDVCQATFLLLARKSSGGLRRQSVAGWLCAT